MSKIMIAAIAIIIFLVGFPILFFAEPQIFIPNVQVSGATTLSSGATANAVWFQQLGFSSNNSTVYIAAIDPNGNYIVGLPNAQEYAVRIFWTGVLLGQSCSVGVVQITSDSSVETLNLTC